MTKWRKIWKLLNTPISQLGRKPEKRSYSGAKNDRLTLGWKAYSTSVDSEIYHSLRNLRNRSRKEARDNDYANGAINTIVRNVIGEGIPFQSKVRLLRGGGFDDQKNQAIEMAFSDWSKAKNCDVAGKLSFFSMQGLIFRSLVESGEVFIRKIYRPFGDSQTPFALEIIEADQCADDYGYGNVVVRGDNSVRMGVELDGWHRPQAYFMYPYHPGDYLYGYHGSSAGNFRVLKRLPADEVIHLFITERPGQTRGVPWLHSSLTRLHNLSGYEEAELVSVRASASIMGFRQSLSPDALEVNEEGEPVNSLEPGVIKQLAPGESFVGFDPGRPNHAFDPFVRMMLRGVAAGLGTDFESLSRDYSQSNYSSSRLSLLDVRKMYRKLQFWFVENFCQPVYEDWLGFAVMSGVLNFNDYEVNTDRYHNPMWQCRGWEWVDPSKEIQATIMGINNNVTNLTRELAKQGLDVETVLEERAKELQLIRKFEEQYGVSMSTTEIMKVEDESGEQTRPKEG